MKVVAGRARRWLLIFGFLTCAVSVAYSFDAEVTIFKVGEPIHEKITKEALALIKHKYLERIVEANRGVDAGGDISSELHFENCCFDDSVARINYLYRKVLDAVGEKEWEVAADRFGELLHTVQDFYAHSNWVELGEKGLVDARFDYWAHIRRQGLVSGVYRREDVPGHLEPFAKGYPKQCCPERTAHHNELNKDRPNRPNHEEAYKLAVRQTRHEYCRLEALVEKRLGKEALQKLREAWLTDPKASPCGCILTVRALGEGTPRIELIDVPITLRVVAPGTVRVVQFEITVKTRGAAPGLLADDQPEAQAPKEWMDTDGKKRIFSHWELGHRDAVGALVRMKSSGDNPWTVPLECKPGLTLDAIYKPVVEEAPPRTPEPPGEEPPGGGGLG